MNTAKLLTSYDDQQLLERIAVHKDKLALRELYDRYRHSLGSFLRRKVYQDKLVDEIYNDVMMTVWQKAGSFRGESKVSTWIFGVAYRTCASHSRKEMKHLNNRTEVEFDTLESQNDKGQDSVTSHMADQLRLATEKLSDNHREVIELSYFYEHSMAEIAEIVGCPINTVKTRLFHAREKLKRSLSPSAVSAQN